MAKLLKSHQKGIKYPIDFCLKNSKVYIKNVENFKNCVFVKK